MYSHVFHIDITTLFPIYLSLRNKKTPKVKLKQSEPILSYIGMYECYHFKNIVILWVWLQNEKIHYRMTC